MMGAGDRRKGAVDVVAGDVVAVACRARLDDVEAVLVVVRPDLDAAAAGVVTAGEMEWTEAPDGQLAAVAFVTLVALIALRPLRSRRACRALCSLRSGRACRALRSRRACLALSTALPLRAAHATWELPRFEVAREQRVIDDLPRADAVRRQQR